MKKFVFIVLFSFLTGTVSASHIAACQLTYEFIGGSDYLITLTFYRDCSGISEPTTCDVSFISSCGNFTATLTKVTPTGEVITQTCPGQFTWCNGGLLFGCRKFVYQAVVTLSPCSDWMTKYTLCCRNPSNTIQNPTAADLTILATLNNASAPNSSPHFVLDPDFILCNGQPVCLDHGALDPEGDSLVYSLVTPYDDGPGGSVPNVIYLGGYSSTQPFGVSVPVSLDSTNGKICLTPTLNLTTVFALQIDEYRNIGGVPTKIGTVMRDIQLTTLACADTNHAPLLNGINPMATSYDPNDTIYSVSVCEDVAFTFNIYPSDPDGPSNMTMSVYQGINGASVPIAGNGGSHPIGFFNWVPTAADTLGNPHCLIISIKDDHCPYVDIAYYRYYFTVESNPVSLVLPLDTVCDNAAPFALTGGDPPGGTYFGTAVSAGVFDPSLGSLIDPNVIYYTHPSLGCGDTVSDLIILQYCSSVSDADGSSDIVINPNPVGDQLTIRQGAGEPIVGLRIISPLGQIVYMRNDVVLTNGTLIIDVKKLLPGTYYIQLKTENQLHSRLFIKN